MNHNQNLFNIQDYLFLMKLKQLLFLRFLRFNYFFYYLNK